MCDRQWKMKRLVCLAGVLAVAGCSSGPPSLSEPAGTWTELNAPAGRAWAVGSPPEPRGRVAVAPVRVSTLEGPPISAQGRAAEAASQGETETVVAVVAKVNSELPGEAEAALKSEKPGESEKTTLAVALTARPAKAVAKIEEKPKDKPAAAPAALPVWTLAKGETLRSGLQEWAARATCSAPGTTSWQVRWETAVNYPIDAPLRFEGDFRTALGDVLALYQQAEKPLLGETISAQCLARVVER
ncbi:toxin co-regulated pilus biosynthesis Q family protein [Pseudomonas aeruginosa]|uniref:toxin co-regulated pilus biosynthesis Q family protein n=1 Tax=Pseudomonas aeruginosa TaxID=287 RepID=UPI0032B524BA